MSVNTRGVEVTETENIPSKSPDIRDTTKDVISVDFNRPFFHFIVEKSTKMILLAGIVENQITIC